MSKPVYLDNRIVEKCKSNNAKAQMHLYDRYCDAMYKVALRYVNDSFIAEDIMQDAFIKVFQKIHSFKGEVTIGSWIKKIVVNQSIDWLKKKKLELVSMSESEIQITQDDNWEVDDGVSTKEIIKAIMSLPEKYKVILNLYLLEGFDHQEISQVLSITEVASRSQLMRGKNKLRNLLKHCNYA